MKKSFILSNIIVIVLLFSCKRNENVDTKKTPIKRQQPKSVSYKVENTKQWLLTNTKEAQHHIVYAVNRTDKENFAQMDSVIVPTDTSGDIVFYLPFPLTVSYLKDIKKIIYFSYPTQTFAAYENGELIYTGPTNMGRKQDKTPTGLFYANWKAEETTSTFNDEWDLRWNFNVENLLGVGWHQYNLPGYPASHACMRLQENDARYLYEWADQWILTTKESVLAKGTPVIVFGSYDFDAPKPWLQLIGDSKALDITENEIQNQTKPFLKLILAEQKNREMKG
ncbi:MAG: L,D-transpeptidase [Lutibacter sp.]|jgi:lipoprotein-anchoring transpeptidase ErfK/SrfK